MARPPKAKAIERLRKALEGIPELRETRSDSPEFQKWRRRTQLAINYTFGNDSGNSNAFFHKVYELSSLRRPQYVRDFGSVVSLLESMIEETEEYWEDEEQTTSSSTRGEKQEDRDRTLKSSRAPRNDRPSSNKVFVIHGRDEEAKQTVARFLEKLSLKPVILQEQPNEGRTIIEKFEYRADTQFAVALLTPDDAGSLQSNKNKLSPRARQNVIFELGFFIGRLGRNGVCALTKGDVEIPSDYAGVVYIPLDDFDGWKQKLFQELKTAGFQLDADRVFQA